MSKLAVFTSLFALIFMAGICPSQSMAQSPWTQSTLRENKLSVQVEGKVFDREGNGLGFPVVSDSVTNTTLLTADRATDFGSDFGLELRATLPGINKNSFEFRAVIAEWDEQRPTSGANLASPLFPDAANPPTSLQLDIEADYFSFELMRKREVLPGVTVSAGPRFISTSDSINTFSNTPAGPLAGPLFSEFEAKNSLVGGQVGLEFNRPVGQSIYVTLFGRAGGYYNGTRFATSAAPTAEGFSNPIETNRNRSTESFVADLGGRVHFEIIPNGLSSYVGYEATVIDGITLSAENIFNPGRLDTNNTVFFQAITFGVNLSY